VSSDKIILDNIDNDYRSYNELIKLYHTYANDHFRTINVEITQWFSANNCSVLGAILTELQTNFNNINIDPGPAKEILEKNGFMAFFGHARRNDVYDTTISYLVLEPDDIRYFSRYISTELFSKQSLPTMTELIKNRFAKSIYEIFNNAALHSKTKKIFSCGQHFPKKDIIVFTITDSGIGIKNAVNNRFNSNLSSIQAIEWAVEDGNTTKEGVSGGIGFSFLREFAEANRGRIQIISNNGFWELDQGRIKTAFFDSEFPGTVVSLLINTADEAENYVINETFEDIF